MAFSCTWNPKRKKSDPQRKTSLLNEILWLKNLMRTGAVNIKTRRVVKSGETFGSTFS